MKGFVLALKQRRNATRKSPLGVFYSQYTIAFAANFLNTFVSSQTNQNIHMNLWVWFDFKGIILQTFLTQFHPTTIKTNTLTTNPHSMLSVFSLSFKTVPRAHSMRLGFLTDSAVWQSMFDIPCCIVRLCYVFKSNPLMFSPLLNISRRGRETLPAVVDKPGFLDELWFNGE